MQLLRRFLAVCAFVLILDGGTESACAAGEYCDDYWREDPALGARLKAELKRNARAEGVPERLMYLYDQLPNCPACIGGDALHPTLPYMVIVYADDAGISSPGFGPIKSRGTEWNPDDEYAARQGMRDGTVKSYYILLETSACECCNASTQEEFDEWNMGEDPDPTDNPDWNPDADLDTSLSDAHEDPDNLGPDPADLTNIDDKDRYPDVLPFPDLVIPPPIRPYTSGCDLCRDLVNAHNDLVIQINRQSRRVAVRERRLKVARIAIRLMNRNIRAHERLAVSPGWEEEYQRLFAERAGLIVAAQEDEKDLANERAIKERMLEQLAQLKRSILDCEQQCQLEDRPPETAQTEEAAPEPEPEQADTPDPDLPTFVGMKISPCQQCLEATQHRNQIANDMNELVDGMIDAGINSNSIAAWNRLRAQLDNADAALADCEKTNCQNPATTTDAALSGDPQSSSESPASTCKPCEALRQTYNELQERIDLNYERRRKINAEIVRLLGLKGALGGELTPQEERLLNERTWGYPTSEATRDGDPQTLGGVDEELAQLTADLEAIDGVIVEMTIEQYYVMLEYRHCVVTRCPGYDLDFVPDTSLLPGEGDTMSSSETLSEFMRARGYYFVVTSCAACQETARRINDWVYEQHQAWLAEVVLRDRGLIWTKQTSQEYAERESRFRQFVINLQLQIAELKQCENQYCADTQTDRADGIIDSGNVNTGAGDISTPAGESDAQTPGGAGAGSATATTQGESAPAATTTGSEPSLETPGSTPGNDASSASALPSNPSSTGAPDAPEAAQDALPASNLDLDALIAAALAAQSVAAFCDLECPEVITCEIAQQLLQSLADAQFFLERLVEWTEKAAQVHFDHFENLAEQENISDENAANLQLAIGLHKFLHDFGSSMLDIASVIGSARDFAEDAANGDLGDMSPTDLLQQLDSAYESMKDLESGMDTLSSSVSGGEGTGTPLGDATTELLGADINDAKSYVSDAANLLRDGIEKGEIDWATVGQSLGRFAKGISQEELDARKQRLAELQAGQDAEAVARAQAYLDYQLANARRWKAVDALAAVTAKRAAITPCLTELCGSSSLSRAFSASVDAAIFTALNGRDPLESDGWGDVLRALNPFIDPLTERLKKLPTVENYCPLPEDDLTIDIDYQYSFGDSACIAALQPLIGELRDTLDSGTTSGEFTFELPGACSGSPLESYIDRSFGVYSGSASGRRWSQLPQQSTLQSGQRLELSTSDASHDQWGLERIGLAAGAGNINMAALAPTLVAIIDSGIDLQHPDLRDKIWTNPGEIPGNNLDDDNNGKIDDVHGWNYVNADGNTQDDNGHGTLVAGIVAAESANRIGIAGINPQAQLLPIKVTDFVGEGKADHVADAIRYAVDSGASVINISLGGHEFSDRERAAAEYARENDALVVVAAGNQSIDASNFWPAGLDGVITVAALDADNRRANYSNWGAPVDIAAPGSDIVSLRSRYTDLMFFADASYVAGSNIVGDQGILYNASGTSFSAPFVSGVASLLFSLHPDLSADEVQRMILHSADDVETPGIDALTGFGLLNANAALAANAEYFVDAEIASVNPVQRDGRVVVQVIGITDADQFDSAVLELGEGSTPEQWQSVGDPVSSPVRDATLADIDASLLQGSSTWTLRLITTHENGSQREARFALNLQ